MDSVCIPFFKKTNLTACAVIIQVQLLRKYLRSYNFFSQNQCYLEIFTVDDY